MHTYGTLGVPSVGPHYDWFSYSYLVSKELSSSTKEIGCAADVFFLNFLAQIV